MRGTRQSLPTLIEECSDTKTLCALAAMVFDAGQAYSNSKVISQISLVSLGLLVHIQTSLKIEYVALKLFGEFLCHF